MSMMPKHWNEIGCSNTGCQSTIVLGGADLPRVSSFKLRKCAEALGWRVVRNKSKDLKVYCRMCPARANRRKP